MTTTLDSPQTPDLTLDIEEIDPKRAAALLARNPRNRRLSAHRVAKFAREMETDRWRLNGDSIKIDSDGFLRDGQTRLAAIVQSGRTIKSVVVYGIGDAEQETLDSGTRRSMADVLVLRGESESAMLAGALLLGWQVEHEAVQQGGGVIYPTHGELTEYLAANPNIRFSLPFGRVANKPDLRYPSSKAAGLHYLMTKKSAQQADTFWTMLGEGTGLTAQHPVLILRRQLITDREKSRRMREVVMIAITIKAWNAYRLGKIARVAFAWRSAGQAAEAFPSIL